MVISSLAVLVWVLKKKEKRKRSALCHSSLTLIPKVKNSVYVSQYRPISLSNVLFRVFLKVLANRLKRILPHLISDQ